MFFFVLGQSGEVGVLGFGCVERVFHVISWNFGKGRCRVGRFEGDC